MKGRITTLDRLLTETEDLCRGHVGRDAESEQWIATCSRLERIAALRDSVRAVFAAADYFRDGIGIALEVLAAGRTEHAARILRFMLDNAPR